VDLYAEYRTLVRVFLFPWLEPKIPRGVLPASGIMEADMGKGILLWLVGVPIPVIILLWLFFGR
jgi:hypothetical protein